MRSHGTLTKWNDDRGFSFITPARASPEIFVHISAFPRDGVRPRLNELISFEVEAAPDGRQRAVRVMRARQSPATRPVQPRNQSRSRGFRAGGVLVLLAGALMGAYGYSQYTKRLAADQVTSPEIDTPALLASPPAPYACDGRTMCSQMTSCPEATYFIRNCPSTQMDGDGDGVPCESQWCN